MSSKPLRRQLFGIRASLIPSVSITNVFGQEASTLYEDIMDPSSFTTLQFLETPVPGTEEHDQKILEKTKQTEALRKIYTSEQFQHKALGEAVRESLKRIIQDLKEDDWMFEAEETNPVPL
ncbi:hypothetical protein PNEG_02901 [Pneumocystis murina B123]|uniref:Uncharacterized protein n=1 Tax=Pneumocystis murina (strain B123) TaxID=1069680 RepID=M7NNM6_PNEMU|nr:hypothetical protein PNEG_02901 [Pneumocystis murina B123]EMR08724.1 hypothetical protein PNEG_02901 [Pneumocystis murina B123]